MTESEWLASDEPDLMLEQVMGQVSRAQLVDFVRECWRRITPFHRAARYHYTVVEQFAEIADEQSDHDAVIYAAEAALKAAGLAPDRRTEQRFQAEILRRIVGNPFQLKCEQSGE
jgi:hypothetical protein